MSSKNAATASEMINYVLDSLQPSFRTNYKEVLGEFDHYFFKMKPLLNQQEATVLLVGKPGKIGLMQHCGMTAKFSQSFRNSSCVAVSLLSRLADPSCNPSSGTLFANILKTLQVKRGLLLPFIHVAMVYGDANMLCVYPLSAILSLFLSPLFHQHMVLPRVSCFFTFYHPANGAV